MAIKLTYEHVKDKFEAEGYELLEDSYLNSKTKMSYRCPEGHLWKISWCDFNSKRRRCPKCSRKGVSKGQRLDVGFVSSEFSRNGYDLLETSYTSNKTKMLCRCPVGHFWEVCWSDFSRGRRCPECSGKKKSEKQRIDPAIVFEEFSKNGYRLLEDTYINSCTKMRCLCPEGHLWETTWNYFHGGVRCPKCYHNSRKLDYNYVISTIESEGYKVLSEYEGSMTKLKCLCPNGHEWWVTWNKFQMGRRCPKCHFESFVNYDIVLDYMKKYGYTLVSEVYEHSHTKLECVCPDGHTWLVTWSNFKKGCRCPKCLYKTNKSKPESALYQYIKDLGFSVEDSCRDIVPPKEIDIFIPEKRLAVEYCGLYWHSETAAGKNRKYHREKFEICKSKGIRLITIFEDEYLDRPEVVKSRISNALGCIPKRIYARKCVVREVSKEQAKIFLGDYHLQGYAPASACFGLFHNTELVALASLGVPARPHARKDGRIELKRFCTKPGYSVVGGISKVFSVLLKHCKDNGFDSIVSYCDMRWANPFKPIYELLGFHLERESKYTPHYIDKNYMKRRRNQSLALKVSERGLGKTEEELRKEQGYDRIWDCGHRTYVFNL